MKLTAVRAEARSSRGRGHSSLRLKARLVDDKFQPRSSWDAPVRPDDKQIDEISRGFNLAPVIHSRNR